MGAKAKTAISERWWDRKLDSKGRLIMPSPLREILGKEVILRAGRGGRIYVYNKRYDRKVLDECPFWVKDLSMRMRLDALGRITLPKVFRVYIGQGSAGCLENRAFVVKQTDDLEDIPALFVSSDLGMGVCSRQTSSMVGWGEDAYKLFDGESKANEERRMACMAASLRFTPREEVRSVSSAFAGYLHDRMSTASAEELVKKRRQEVSTFDREVACRKLFLVFLLRGSDAEAEKALRVLKRLDKWWYWPSYGALSLRRGELREAADAFARQYSEEKDHFVARYNDAMVCLTRGNFKRALSCLQQVLSGRPELLSVLLTAEDVLDARDWLAGVAYFAASLWSYIGRSPWGQEDLKDRWLCREAYAEAKRRVTSAPKSVGARVDLGVFLLEQMLFEDAVEQFMQAMVLKPNAQGVLTYLAIALLGCGREREVVRLLLRDARGVEKPRGALYALALALAKKGESEKACELLMKSRKGWRSSVGSTLASIDIASRVLYDWRYGQEDEKEGSKKSS